MQLIRRTYAALCTTNDTVDLLGLAGHIVRVWLAQARNMLLNCLDVSRDPIDDLTDSLQLMFRLVATNWLA